MGGGWNVLMSFIQRSGSGASARTYLGKTTRQDGYLRHRMQLSLITDSPSSRRPNVRALKVTCTEETRPLLNLIPEISNELITPMDHHGSLVNCLFRCRHCRSVSQAWKQNPLLVAAQANTDGNLWTSVRASLDDCKNTLEKLKKKIDEVQKSSFLGRGFLRKPTMSIKLNMKMRDITTFKQQIHSYNSAMQSALQMINM